MRSHAIYFIDTQLRKIYQPLGLLVIGSKLGFRASGAQGFVLNYNSFW